MNQHYKDLSKRSTRCIYCGEPANSKDHVLPKSRYELNYQEGLYIVPCCSSCNSIAGRTPFRNIREKQSFIRLGIRKRIQWLMIEEPRRRSWYESLLVIAERRLAWPNVTTVELILPEPAPGKDSAAPPAVTRTTESAPLWHDAALILDPDFDEE